MGVAPLVFVFLFRLSFPFPLCLASLFQQWQLGEHFLYPYGRARHRLGHGQGYDVFFLGYVVDNPYHLVDFHAARHYAYGGYDFGRVEHVHVEMHHHP